MSSVAKDGMRVVAVVLAALVAVTVASPMAAPAAAAGVTGRDPGYGGSGALELPGFRSRVAVDAMDRMVVLSQFEGGTYELRRYLPSGAPDPSFDAVAVPVGGETYDNAVSVLDDGVISVVSARSSADGSEPNTLTVVHVTDGGQLDAGYGTGGVLVVSSVGPGDVHVQQADGSLVVEVAHSGPVVRFDRYGPDGRLDTGFGGSGHVAVSCCGAAPTSPDAVDLEPGGAAGGVVALVAQGSSRVLVRIADDGTAGPQVTPGTGGNVILDELTALPDGGFLLTTRDKNDTSLRFHRRLRPDLTADPTFFGVIAQGPVLQVVQVGRRVLVAAERNGRATVTAINGGGADFSYGTNGVATSELPPNRTGGERGTSALAVAIAADGRAFVSGTYGTGPGPLSSVVDLRRWNEAIDGDGRSLQTWDGGDGNAQVQQVVAERVGHGFLVNASQQISRVERWVPPEVPGPVVGVATATHGATVTISWKPPVARPGVTVTGYQVRAARGWDDVPLIDRTVTGLSTDLTFADLGTTYRIQVRAVAAGGSVGPAAVAVAIPPLPSLEGFVDRVWRDISGRAPTSQERASDLAALRAVTVEAGTYVYVAADSSPLRAPMDPVVRLYEAYFQRPPDSAGLRYWLGRRRSGMTVVRISAVFAASSEFRRTYGALGNAAFVKRVYLNVLGRPADGPGAAYWTKRLDSRATSRGQLMASMSEGQEHKRRISHEAMIVAIYWGLLDRSPTTAEWAGGLDDGDIEQEMRAATAVLSSPEYLARWS